MINQQQQKKAQIGIVFNPIRDDMFSAIKGQGAYLNGRTIRPSGQKGNFVRFSKLFDFQMKQILS